ncbi:MAG: hypothetical protein L6R42_002318 [Xanthoria sp. 1 TBL-2021]|nr:MAG: hypothetical protein L6R42_002318 [Xanthoria sp. 1 TBL-2021]
MDAAKIMQTIQEEDEHTQTARAASRELTITTLPVTDPSSSTQQTRANPDVGDPHPPVPMTKEGIPETRFHYLRNIFNGPPSNLPPSSAATTPFNRPVYDNQIPGIPTHWIPIYGAGHGTFYDPITKLFHGDGPPRPDLERLDGSMPEMDSMEPLPRFGEHREDCLHIQPRAVTDALIRRMQASPIIGRRYYCTCQHTWLAQRHDCPDDRMSLGMPWAGGVPQRGMTVAVRPGDTIPVNSFTHDLAVGDLGYLTAAQRYAYDNNLPMSTAASIAPNEPRAARRMSGTMRTGGGQDCETQNVKARCRGSQVKLQSKEKQRGAKEI